YPGSIYTIGYFGGTTDFDLGSGVYNITCLLFSQDVFVLKMGPDNTGFADNDLKNIFNLSPNPATDKIYISFPASETQTVTVKIYSITGEVVFTEENKTTELQTLNFKLQTSIDVTGLSNGLYFLSVQTGREVVSRKIVVDH
ncbi:MAG: T9SS type A sorting domain-containing protein, partial [Bacteroidota bacterium]